jgi:hypothetical protein
MINHSEEKKRNQEANYPATAQVLLTINESPNYHKVLIKVRGKNIWMHDIKFNILTY